MTLFVKLSLCCVNIGIVYVEIDKKSEMYKKRYPLKEIHLRNFIHRRYLNVLLEFYVSSTIFNRVSFDIV